MTSAAAIARLATLVDRLGRAAHCVQFAHGLNPAQWEALRYVSRANRYSLMPSALAEYLGTTKGTASQTLKSLEAKGLVRRARGTADRRSVLLELTDQGATLLKSDPLLERVETAARVLDREPQDAAALLDRLLAGFQKSCGMREFGVCGQCGHMLPPGGCTSGEAGRCGITGEALSEQDAAKICINFRNAAADRSGSAD